MRITPDDVKITEIKHNSIYSENMEYVGTFVKGARVQLPLSYIHQEGATAIREKIESHILHDIDYQVYGKYRKQMAEKVYEMIAELNKYRRPWGDYNIPEHDVYEFITNLKTIISEE